MRARSAFSIQKDVIFAILVREMNARFSSYTFGNIWLVLEPLLMMVMFIILFGLRGRGEFGYVAPPIFVFAGFLPFKILWQLTMRRNMSALAGARGLMGFRQVRLFDIFLAHSFLEGCLFLVVGVLMGLGLYWFGFDATPRDPLLLLGWCAILWLFAASVGILACVVSQFAREIEKVINMIQMPLLFTSAVFFPMTIIPEPYRSILAWNPLVHAMELIREAWFPVYESPVADGFYLFLWAIGAMALAISSYRLSWQRILAQ
ncbi:ABC transporter permease [Kordiimonas lipolytica]|uniref:Transport permease protein n=1 Tax=Kordiimonas lipolytica TaxID=1662421 RepID=A0ABV8U8H6_9PROT|nr:ABC transporter permease [Kordiimonas lipolytica]